MEGDDSFAPETDSLQGWMPHGASQAHPRRGGGAVHAGIKACGVGGGGHEYLHAKVCPSRHSRDPIKQQDVMSCVPSSSNPNIPRVWHKPVGGKDTGLQALADRAGAGGKHPAGAGEGAGRRAGLGP